MRREEYLMDGFREKRSLRHMTVVWMDGTPCTSAAELGGKLQRLSSVLRDWSVAFFGDDPARVCPIAEEVAVENKLVELLYREELTKADGAITDDPAEMQAMVTDFGP
ncbi:hypothetical protein ACP70R_003229 [Stipagrostis hirtigluma subsp. patula]